MSSNILVVCQQLKGYSKKLNRIVSNQFKIKFDLTKASLIATAIASILFIMLIISSLFFSTSINQITSVATNLDTWQALKITIASIFCSTIITIVMGVPLAYLIVNRESKIKRIANLVLSIPLILPPAVAGLALLMTFGRRGILSIVLVKLDLGIPFTFLAVVITQVFTMMPLFTHSLKSGFEAINKQVREAAMVCGADEKEILLFIYLPLSMRSFMTGVIIGCLRAAGEFGATIMFAGNLEGTTQTLATRIYTLAQNNIEQAIALAVVLIITFLIPLLILELSKKR
jgi:molybdate transport system permease protein